MFLDWLLLLLFARLLSEQKAAQEEEREALKRGLEVGAGIDRE